MRRPIKSKKCLFIKGFVLTLAGFLLYPLLAQAAQDILSLDKDKLRRELTDNLRQNIEAKIEAAFIEAANKAEGEVRDRTYFDELLRPYERFGVKDTNFATTAVELCRGYKQALEEDQKSGDPNNPKARSFLEGQVKSTISSVLMSSLDKNSQEIVSSWGALIEEAQANLQKLTDATQEIADADPKADVTQILIDHGLQGDLINGLEFLEVNYNALKTKYSNVSEMYRAYTIIRQGMGSDNPGDKIDALFTLGAEFGGKIPVLGKFVELYSKVAQEMINAVGRLGKMLRARQGYCVGQGTTGHIKSKWMDERSARWADQFPGIDACPHHKMGIYRDIYEQQGALLNLYFWVGGRFVKGKPHGGISDVKAMVQWLRRNGYKSQATDITFIANAYNISPGFIQREKNVRKMALEMQSEIRRIVRQMMCNKEETQRFLLQDMGLEAVIKALEMDTGLVDYFPFVDDIVDKVIEDRLIKNQASFYNNCTRALQRLKDVYFVQIDGTVKDEDGNGVAGMDIEVSPQSKVLEDCSKLVSNDAGTFRIVLQKKAEESFTAKIKATSEDQSSTEESLSIAGTKENYTCNLEVEGSKLDSIVLSPAEKTIFLDETVTFTVTGIKEDGSKTTVPQGEVKWGEAEKGVFTGKEVGTHTITAQYEEEFAKATVDVQEKEIDSLKVAADKTEVKVGEKVTLSATVVYKDKTTRNVTDETTFEPSEVDTSQGGSKEITGTYKDVSGTVTIKVIDRKPQSLSLEADKNILTAGEEVSITAILTYDDGSTEDVTQSDVIQFNPASKFKPEKAGAITVEATYTQEGDPPIAVSASTTITVKKLTAIVIVPDQAKVKINERLNLKAMAQFEDGSSEDYTSRAGVTWNPSSSFMSDKPGAHPITVKFNDKKGTAVITVEDDRDKEEDEEDKNLDEILDELGDEQDKDPCDPAEFNANIEKFHAMKSNIESRFNRFTAASNKFYQEINSRRSDPCTNGMVAFTYYTAKTLASEVENISEEMKSVYTSIVVAGTLCEQEGIKDKIKSLLYEFNDVGSRSGTINRTLAAMQGRLNELACDEDEVSRNGGQITAQGEIDPEFLQDGGSMGEVQGDSIDQTGEGFQDEGVGGPLSIYVWDSGSAKDDIFQVSITGYGSLGRTRKGGRTRFGPKLDPGKTYTVVITTIETDVGAGTWSVKVDYKGQLLVPPTQGSDSGAVSFTIPEDMRN